jgi:Zn-dependent M28 family amino/carboxypeptidase
VALAAIARRNGGSRDVGSSGYSQSVAYVVRRLRAVGYRARLRPFSFKLFRETKPPRLEKLAPGPERYREGRDFVTMRYSGSGDVSASLVPVDFQSTASGCGRSDFDHFPDGAIALVRRGECFLSEKARNAEAAGARGVLIANSGVPGQTAPVAGTLVKPGIRVPVLGISSALGTSFVRSAQAGTVRVRIAVTAVTRPSRAANVVADLPGRERGVVLLGAHLDSVSNGPGINDNGSGTALVLEIARQARRLGIRPRHGLRFAFWGAEELGLVGSGSYVAKLSRAGRAEILADLNFDRVGSPNYGRFVYDGDRAPPGSMRIESAFRSYFTARGLPYAELELGGRSDHAPVALAGIPVGGLFTGADEVKSATQVRRFGGSAGPYDACYHQACDTLANVDVRVLSEMADAAATVALRLAR